jgi:cytochrome bd-type quinol oxidase subunit 1
MAFGRSPWTPYGGLTPEAFARRQRYIRQLWLCVAVVVIVIVALAVLQLAE